MAPAAALAAVQPPAFLSLPGAAIQLPRGVSAALRLLTLIPSAGRPIHSRNSQPITMGCVTSRVLKEASSANIDTKYRNENFKDAPASAKVTSDCAIRLLTIPRGDEQLTDVENGGSRGTAGTSWQEATPASWQGHLVYPRSFYELFVKHASGASEAVWGKGNGPFSDLEDDLAWLAFPDLGPPAQELRQGGRGAAPELRAFMQCFPHSKDSFTAVSNLLMFMFVVDDFLEKQGAQAIGPLVEWCGALWRQSASGTAFDSQAAFDALPTPLTAHPRLRKVSELYCSALGGIAARAAQLDPSWLRRYMWADSLCVKGVATELETARKFKGGEGLPTIPEYYDYRIFSSAVFHLVLIGALEKGIRLSDARFAAARPMLVCTGLVAGCFNDTFVATKEPADGLFNTVSIVGKARAVAMHNALVDCLCNEADKFLATAEAGDSSKEFVDLLKAGLFGASLWHNICPAYRKYLTDTDQPFGIVDYPGGQLVDAQSALTGEMGQLVHSLASALPSDDCPPTFRT